MTRFDDEFDPADAIDPAQLDRLGEPDDLSDCLLDDEDLALLRSRPKRPPRPKKKTPTRRR